MRGHGHSCSLAALCPSCLPLQHVNTVCSAAVTGTALEREACARRYQICHTASTCRLSEGRHLRHGLSKVHLMYAALMELTSDLTCRINRVKSLVAMLQVSVALLSTVCCQRS
jgi:hypothetical protein